MNIGALTIEYALYNPSQQLKDFVHHGKESIIKKSPSSIIALLFVNVSFTKLTSIQGSEQIL